jgi:hypothetical protein
MMYKDNNETEFPLNAIPIFNELTDLLSQATFSTAIPSAFIDMGRYLKKSDVASLHDHGGPSASKYWHRVLLA